MAINELAVAGFQKDPPLYCTILCGAGDKVPCGSWYLEMKIWKPKINQG